MTAKPIQVGVDNPLKGQKVTTTDTFNNYGEKLDGEVTQVETRRRITFMKASEIQSTRRGGFISASVDHGKLQQMLIK